MLTYKVKFNLNNGYRCGCCRHSWTEDEILQTTLTDHDDLHFKRNHKLLGLEEDIFKLGCRAIDEKLSGDEFEGTYSLVYSFYNEAIEDDSEISWENPFDLKARWAAYEKASSRTKR